MKRRIEEQILLLAYGELDASEAEALTRRIEADPALRALYEEHSRVRQATRAVPTPPTPSLTIERLRARILSESVPKRATGWAWAFGGGGVALAGVLTLLMVNLPTDSEVGGLSTQKPPLTVALNDLPAPHEWVPALIHDISDEQPAPGSSTETVRAVPPNGASGERSAGGKSKAAPEETTETAVTQPARNAAKGAAGHGDGDAGEPAVVVIGANGSAVELEGTDGVAFGG